MPSYFIGVDVGTGSARAGIFTSDGTMLSMAKRDLKLFKYDNDFIEQSSADIWARVCECVREALNISEVDPAEVKSVGFDATCSLVVIGPNGTGLTVGKHGDPERDVILWMDHRAIDQANRINETKHPVLSFVGNRISPEMETPKLLWLRENLPQTYEQATHFFDLTDYLTWKATGSLTRSACTVTCKWTYLAHESSWDADYFNTIGLEDLSRDQFTRIGTEVVSPGTPLAKGLTAQAAADLGLVVGTSVPAGLIDAHAGGVGTVGANNLDGSEPEDVLAYVFGTSACTMTTTSKQVCVPGIWGPYFSAMVPGKWLLEAGQSAAGAAIDHLVSMSPAYNAAKAHADKQGMATTQWISQQIKTKLDVFSDAIHLAKGLHVVPEFLGNRAPLADPKARAIIAGLDMNRSIDSLMSVYIAGIAGLGYSLRQIIDAQSDKGVRINKIAISGGAGADPLIRQLIADATGIAVVSAKAEEPVLLGSAILGATSSGHFTSLSEGMRRMAKFDKVYYPCEAELADVHLARYVSFKALQKIGLEIR